MVLQPAGADRRLRALAGLVAEPGAVLVAHRPERRAVVRRGDGAFTKAVRPGRRVPVVLAVDPAAGTVTTGALPGRTLHELLRAGSPQAVPAAEALGVALAVLHAAAAPPGAPQHDGAAELAVLRRWSALACAHGVGSAGDGAEEAEQDAEHDAQLARPAGRLVPVPRDRHAKPALVAAAGGTGLLDFDLAGLGEPALDLANLLVHLELRVEQGLVPAELAGAGARAVLGGYDPPADVVARLPVYRLATARRLAAVYAFRPAHAAAAGRLLEQVRRTG